MINALKTPHRVIVIKSPEDAVAYKDALQEAIVTIEATLNQVTDSDAVKNLLQRRSRLHDLYLALD